MREIVLLPTYRRPEMLFYCLTLIRHFEPKIQIAVFPDRGTRGEKEFQNVMDCFDREITVDMQVPEHDYYGNSMNTMEAFRWAFNSGFDRIFYVEDDVMIHADFFKWHRQIHEEYSEDMNLFASMAWVFNHYAPITQDVLIQPWYYSVGTCFARKKLELIVQHATPRYYKDTPGYIDKVFHGSALNSPMNISHYEQDGLIQRVLDLDKSQTITSGMARCTHLGAFGYNKGWEKRSDFFGEAKTFEERVARISKLVGDPYWRAPLFGGDIVARASGKILPPRLHKYLLRVGPFECDYESELEPEELPKRLRSVPRTPEMEIMVE